MIKLKKNLLEVKNSNLVFLLEKVLDLKQLKELSLDKKILSKLENVIKE
jgi:hypothetical protein